MIEGANMQFYMIIGKNKLYVYRLKNEKLEPEFIDGNSFCNYAAQGITGSVSELLSSLADVNNLDGIDDVEVSVVLNTDRVRNVNALKALDGHILQEIPLEDILVRVIKRLSKDNQLKIAEFGINYDGDAYILHEGKLEKKPYSLLAYSIGQEELIVDVVGR